VDISHLIEKKGKQDYLSWANAWNELKTIHPDAQRVVYENDMGLPYFTDGNTAMVKVGVIVNDIEHIDYLPIMDYRNSSITLDKVTTFDIVKTIQRSTVKAIGLHGLGINLWMGEDTKVERAKPITPVEKVRPKKGDKAWKDKIVPWIEKNKDKMSLDHVISTLQKGYFISASLKKHIEDEYNSK
tara:strand:+ start:3876 stop:4430 length:555 start_codon:yes stop_codon:yes gene_type:complete